MAARLVVVCGSVLALLGLALPGGVVSPAWHDTAGPRAVVAASLVAALLVVPRGARRDPPPGRLTDRADLAVLLALPGAPLSCSWLLADAGHALTGVAEPVLTVGCVLTAGGALATAVLTRRARAGAAEPDGVRAAPRRLTPAVAVAVAGVAAVAAVAAPLGIAAATVRTQTAEPRAVPPRASGPLRAVPWVWQPSAYVVDARSAGPGVVLGLGDGRVVALDGATGAERWSYQRRGTTVTGLGSSLSGRTVVAHLDAERQEVTAVLDATTGTPIRVWAGERVAKAYTSLDDDTVSRWTSSEGGPARLVTEDLRTGAPRWSWQVPAGCRPEPDLHGTASGPVLVRLECPTRDAATRQVWALARSDGRPLWQRDVGSAHAGGTWVEASPDGRLVAVTADGGATLLVRSTTGEVVHQEPRGWTTLPGDTPFLSPGSRYEAPTRWIDDAGATHPVRAPSCPGPVSSASGGGHLYLLCPQAGAPAAPWQLLDVELASGRAAHHDLPTAFPDAGPSDPGVHSLLAAPGAVVAVHPPWPDEAGTSPAPILGFPSP